ncbi:MAG: DNA N-6-adenine-methyltransferase [Desulfatiglandales bacterium]
MKNRKPIVMKQNPQGVSHIKIRRKTLELTQREVCLRAEFQIPLYRYSAIERGVLKADHLDRERIARALGVDERALWEVRKPGPEDINEEWFTPRFILEKLGKFDLDPCTAKNRPWPTALHHITKKEDGLSADWSGRVWCNPPFGEMGCWMAWMAVHGNGILLSPASKMETLPFFKYVWSQADAILIMRGRLRFHTADGRLAGRNPTFSTVFVAYGTHNADVLRLSGIEGVFIPLKGYARILHSGMFSHKIENLSPPRPPFYHRHPIGKQ